MARTDSSMIAEPAPVADDRTSYVYAVFRLDGTPCYIGKGRGGRWKSHERGRSSNRRLAKMIAHSPVPLPIVKVREGLTNEEALAVEAAFIAALGRGRKGPLVNMTDGGEGTVGYKWHPDYCAKAKAYWETPEGQIRKARLSVWSAAQMTPEMKEKLRDINRTRKTFLGKKHSPEWIAMMKVKVAASNSTRETTDQTRALRSAKMKAMWADPDIRQRMLTRKSRVKKAAA